MTVPRPSYFVASILRSLALRAFADEQVKAAILRVIAQGIKDSPKFRGHIASALSSTGSNASAIARETRARAAGDEAMERPLREPRPAEGP